MNKILKFFLLALTTSLLLLFIAYGVSKLINNVDEGDFIRIYVTAFIIFFTPIFLSLTLSKKNTTWKYVFVSPFISFFAVYILIFIHFKTHQFREEFAFFEVSSFLNASMSFFTALFVNFLMLLRVKKTDTTITSMVKLNYSYKVILLIPLSLTLVYSLLIFIGSSSFLNALSVWSNLFPLGVLSSLLSINFFEFIYKKFFDKKRIVAISLFYVLVPLAAVFVNMTPMIISSYSVRFNFKFLQNLIFGNVLFAPFFIFTLLLTHLYFLKILSKIKTDKLKRQSLESQVQYQQLKNQLSPHFLFNNINVLSSFIEENPKKAVTYANNLANIYHYFLEQEKEDVVKVREEINFAKQYLELLKDRFEEGLQYQINIDENIKNNYITATILQQVLENVVKHNIIDKNSLIKISISSTENYLVISNNKNLKQQEKSRSKKGIENIQKRIAFFTDKKVIIENTDRNYTVKLPILETI